MPLRSTGCHKCRARKIRCDERRPGCMRCATHGVACPGYKTEAGGVEFRDETNQTVLRLNTHDYTASHTGQRKPKKSPKELHTRTSPAGNDPILWKGSTGESVEDTHDPTALVPSGVKLHVQQIRSPNANRQALWGKFMSLYHPHNKASNEKGLWVSHLDYMSSLIAMPSRPPSLSNGLDALSLVQIGSIYNDKRLLGKATEAYGKALRSLAFALERPGSIHDDTVLAAATILSTSEFYTEFRLQGQNWISHQQGMQRLIEIRGPESLSRSPLAIHLFYQSTSSALAMSLMIRKANPYASEKWQSMRDRVAQHDDYSESFRTSLRLPELLERHDLLDLNDVEALRLIDDLLAECSELEIEMNDYLANLHVNTEAIECWPALVDIEVFSPFAKLVTDRTLSRAYKFPTFMTAYLYSSHWMRMYMLRETVQSLHAKRMILVPSWTPAATEVVQERELLSYILDQCRQIPYFIEPGNSAIGEMCCFFPLSVAETYFRRNSHWRWVRWVHHLSDRIFHKGMSMPFVTDRQDVPSPRSDGTSEEQYGFNWLEWPPPPQVQHVSSTLSPVGNVWALATATSFTSARPVVWRRPD